MLWLLLLLLTHSIALVVLQVQPRCSVCYGRSTVSITLSARSLRFIAFLVVRLQVRPTHSVCYGRSTVLIVMSARSPRTPSIYATDRWSGRVGEAKYKRRDVNNNKTGCKVRNAKCQMGECDCNCECKCGCNAFLSAPSEMRPALSKWQLSSTSSETGPAMSVATQLGFG